MRARVYTLGCRVNHYESQMIRERLSGLPGTGEVHVVNTCAVTSLAARKGRKLVRKLRREHPRALIVAVGCQATDSPGELRAAGADLVISNRDKARIREIVLAYLEGKNVPGDGWLPLGAERISRDAEQIRANLKVQDGCTVACTFCKTWQVRGPLRSKPPEVAREEAECLAEAGHPEIVIAGINLVQYGEDLPGRPSLVDLLRELLRVPGVRIRLSSLNPEGVTDELIGLFAAEPRRLCPYLHVPLQSGDDRVLSRMGRPYTADEYRERIGRFLEEVPVATFGADVMVGFPDQVPAGVKRERVQALEELSRRTSLEVRRRFLGKVLHPVLETKRDGTWIGHAENYIIVALSPDGLPEGPKRGTIFPVRITEIGEEDTVVGVIQDNQDLGDGAR